MWLQKIPLKSLINLMIDTSAMQEMEMVAWFHHIGSSCFYPPTGCAADRAVDVKSKYVLYL